MPPTPSSRGSTLQDENPATQTLFSEIRVLELETENDWRILRDLGDVGGCWGMLGDLGGLGGLGGQGFRA